MPFEPGNQEWRKRRTHGPPPSAEAEKLRGALGKVVDNGTLKKWADAMKERLEQGDMDVTRFVFERIIGKVPNVADVAEDGTLAELLARWIARGDGNDGAAAP